MLNKLKEILETKTGMEVIFEDDPETPLFIDIQTANVVLLVYNNLISTNAREEFEKYLETKDRFIRTAELCWRCIK